MGKQLKFHLNTFNFSELFDIGFTYEWPSTKPGIRVLTIHRVCFSHSLAFPFLEFALGLSYSCHSSQVHLLVLGCSVTVGCLLEFQVPWRIQIWVCPRVEVIKKWETSPVSPMPFPSESQVISSFCLYLFTFFTLWCFQVCPLSSNFQLLSSESLFSYGLLN